MLPTPTNYAIYPGVVPANTAVEMTIVPTERSFLFFSDMPYLITVISVNADEPYYHVPQNPVTFSVTAQGGVLHFSYSFPDEQEHLILLSREGEKPFAELSVYSLFDDLFSLRPLRGDLHSHSYRSDGRRDPSALAGHYREQGYDFFALTDHNRAYPGDEIDQTYAGVKMGLARVRGEEIHAPGSVLHVVHVGGKESVAERYVHDMEGYEREIAEYESRVPGHIPAQYHARYARAMWTADQIHAAGGLAIFAHPYWRPGRKAFNVCDAFARILLMSGMFDAYELVGGMGQEGINRSIALWQELRAEGLNLPVVGSSDVHGIAKAETFPHLFTICFAEQNENDAIIAAVKAGRSVAVEASGGEYDRQYRCYGSLRLVGYAHFLLRRYFPQIQRICAGEGVAMRAYAMGEADAALIEQQAAQTENFRRRFFGEILPVVPSQAVQDFTEHCRDRQKNGPDGKGSLLGTGKIQL
ncbi:MAG: PHP domain-containing protein [Clostridia bacterium]|nr:PHP domain-containing protein [Clostridia bacterium]